MNVAVILNTDEIQQELIMHKNKLIELTKYTKRPTEIGIKLRETLLTQHTDSSEDKKFTEAKDYIRTMTLSNEELADLRKQLKNQARPQREREINARVAELGKKSDKILPKLDQLIKDINQQSKQEVSNGDKSSLLPCMDITRKANNVISQFKKQEQLYSNMVKNTIKRQATILQGDISDQDVDKIVHQPELAQQMLRQKLLDSPSIQLENSVSDIVDKCRDILQLQKSMHECLEMMRELAILVNYQSQQLNVIEDTLIKADQDVNNGEVKLVEAKELHKKGNKKICCIMMIVLTILGIIIIPIVITQVAK